MAAGRLLPLLALTGLSLSACSTDWIGEDRLTAMQEDWNRLYTTDWEEASRVNEALPSPQYKERLAEENICNHPNTAMRVTTQDGVSDHYSYRHCPLSPYDTKGGTRMGIRPDGNGTVVKN